MKASCRESDLGGMEIVVSYYSDDHLPVVVRVETLVLEKLKETLTYRGTSWALKGRERRSVWLCRSAIAPAVASVVNKGFKE